LIKIFLILFLATTIYASDIKLASVIFDKIITGISKKENVKIYVHKQIKSITNYKEKFNIVDDCSKADIVLLSTTNDIPSTCKNKILFGTRYSHLKNKNVVGSFFWQKGRPNILFYKSRLLKNNIKLDSSFDKYIEEE
jgi:hypothetical protein